MITKTTKVLFFAALIAAIVIPIYGMDFATGQEQVTKQTLQIPIPEDSAAKIAHHERAMALFAEKDAIKAEGAELRALYEESGTSGLTSQNIADLDRVTAELKDVNERIDQMTLDGRALITLTPSDKLKLEDNLQTIIDSNVPYNQAWTDENAEAIGIGFANQEEADTYAEILETIIDVPFYVEVRGQIVPDTCTGLTANCDPLLGGVQIKPHFSSTQWGTCSYSTAVDRDVWWWTDYGFITSAHCFENNANGNQVKQPTSSDSVIGTVNMWKWDTTNAQHETAFVKKSGTETHAAAAYNGAPAIYFGGFADPAVNDYVTIVGKNGIHTSLQVDSVTLTFTANSFDSPAITHTHQNFLDMDNWGTTSGDSGGVVHADGSDPNYHGIIFGHDPALPIGSGGHTIASKWSNIDSYFGFNQ